MFAKHSTRKYAAYKNIQTNSHIGSHPETSKFVIISYPIGQWGKDEFFGENERISGINVSSFLNRLFIALLPSKKKKVIANSKKWLDFSTPVRVFSGFRIDIPRPSTLLVINRS